MVATSHSILSTYNCLHKIYFKFIMFIVPDAFVEHNKFYRYLLQSDALVKRNVGF